MTDRFVAHTHDGFTVKGTFAGGRRPDKGDLALIATILDLSGFARGEVSVKLSRTKGGRELENTIRMNPTKNFVTFVMQRGGDETAYEVTLVKPHTESSLDGCIEKLRRGAALLIEKNRRAKAAVRPLALPPPRVEPEGDEKAHPSRPTAVSEVDTNLSDLKREKERLEDEVIRAHDGVSAAEAADIAQTTSVVEAQTALEAAQAELTAAEERVRACKQASEREWQRQNLSQNALESAKQALAKLEEALRVVEERIDHTNKEKLTREAEERARQLAETGGEDAINAMIAALLAQKERLGNK